jgi:hypothetical protein
MGLKMMSNRISESAIYQSIAVQSGATEPVRAVLCASAAGHEKVDCHGPARVARGHYAQRIW